LKISAATNVSSIENVFVERNMRQIVVIAVVLCLAGCSVPQNTRHGQEVSQDFRKQFYTDAEAAGFLAKLPKITYPSTIPAVCTQLGIDLSRLGVDTSRPIHRQLYGPGSGVTQWHTSQLSQSYSIAFLHNINDKTPNEYRIYRVDIWRFREKEDKDTEHATGN
jgi:hypothetical protein